MKQVYVVRDDRTDDIIAVFSALKRAKEFIIRQPDGQWLVIEYCKLL